MEIVKKLRQNSHTDCIASTKSATFSIFPDTCMCRSKDPTPLLSPSAGSERNSQFLMAAIGNCIELLLEHNFKDNERWLQCSIGANRRIDEANVESMERGGEDEGKVIVIPSLSLSLSLSCANERPNLYTAIKQRHKNQLGNAQSIRQGWSRLSFTG